MFRLHEGKTDEAWQDLLACHRLARLVARGPFLVSCAGRVGHRSMGLVRADAALAQYGKPTAERARRFQADLQRLPPLPAMAELLDAGERLVRTRLPLLAGKFAGGPSRVDGILHGKPWRDAVG